MWHEFLDFFFPRVSLTGRVGEWVMPEERERILHLSPVIVCEHELRRQGLRSLDRVVAGAPYGEEALLRCAIHRFKYRGVRAYAGILGEMLLRAADAGWRSGGAGHHPLCPVPLHWTRVWNRGFNQAELLARQLASACLWPLCPLLRRTRPTGFQSHRKEREERFASVSQAFSVRPGALIPASIILIDDLFTSGATLDACASVLKNAGVKRVEGLVVARG